MVGVQQYNQNAINILGGDLTVSQTGTTPSFFHAGGFIQISPGMALRMNGGEFTFGAGGITGRGTLALTNTSANFGTSPNLGALVMQGSTASFPGGFETYYTSLNLANSSLSCETIVNAFDHTIPINASTINAAMTNAGTLDIQGASSLLGLLDNQGLMTIQNGLTLNKDGADHLNSGSIQVNGGTFAIMQSPVGTPSFTNKGTSRVSAGAVLRPIGGSFTNDVTGVLAGTGTFDMSVTSFVNNGTISPGASPGIMNFEGALVMGPTSVLDIEIGGVAAGADYDRLSVIGTAVLDGSLRFTMLNGFASVPGDSFEVMTFGSHFGAFDQFTGLDMGGDRYLVALPRPADSGPNPITFRTLRQKWTSLVPGGATPGARQGHSAVYDAASNRMIVFGGRGSSGVLGDAWILSNANGLGGTPAWTPLSTSGTPPASREGHSAVYDAASNRMILFGGVDGAVDPASFGDTWVLSNANGLSGTPTWTEILPVSGSPGRRSGHGAGYNPVTRRMVVFGGSSEIASCDLASPDIWVLANANGLGGPPSWILLNPAGVPPTSRFDGAIAYDPAGNRLIVFGGEGPCPAVNADTFILEGADGVSGTPAWSQRSFASPTPPAVTGMDGIYDGALDRFMSFGGRKADGGLDSSGEVLFLTNVNGAGSSGWTTLPPPITRPEPRTRHSATYDMVNHRMTVFGGSGAGGLLGDSWVIEISGEPIAVSSVESTLPPRIVAGIVTFSRAPSPNPTPRGTLFSVYAREDAAARITVFDVTGREVAVVFDGRLARGDHALAWDGVSSSGEAASGVYFLRLESGSDREMQRIVLAR